MTMQSAKVDRVDLSFTEADLERAFAAKVHEVEGWHEPLVVEVGIPAVCAHHNRAEGVETFRPVKPPHVRALV